MRVTVFILVFGLALPAGAQFRESFEDGELGRDPYWMGVLQSWQVVPKSDVAAGAPGSGTLRLNAPTGAGVAWLATQVKGSWGDVQEWSFFLGRRSQAEAYNCALFWLYASEPTVASTTIDGYRVRFGDNLPSGDRIVVEQVTNGTASPFINSREYVPQGLTDYGLLVRVTRTAGGLWTLYTSVLPVQPGTGAIATDQPGTADVWQGAAINKIYTRFDDGYLALGTIYTNSVAAHTGLEFDQIQFTGSTACDVLVNKAGGDHQNSNSTRNGLGYQQRVGVRATAEASGIFNSTGNWNIRDYLNIRNRRRSLPTEEKCGGPQWGLDQGRIYDYINKFYYYSMPGLLGDNEGRSKTAVTDA